jgi:predicted Zn-dependent protease
MKFRALTLVFALLCASMPVGAYAADDKPTTQSSQSADTANQDTAAQVSKSDKSDNKDKDKTDKDKKAQEQADKTDQEHFDPKDIKAGSLEDVSAIGNRDIGGRGLGDWYSLEKEIRIGKEYAQQVEASVKLVQDPVINEYVNRIGQNIVRNSDAKVPFTIKVVDSDEVNAFALPGGFFYVDTGLILAADNESELAGVMAHEIAHVCARHAMREMTRSQLANLASIPLIFLGGGIGMAVRSAAGFGLPLTFLTFSRGFEAEADYLGIQYMYAAGYDPQSFISFFEKIQAREKEKPGTLAKAFSTHPQTPDRIEKSQEEIATILPPRNQYIVDTSEFEQVKARLAALENRRKVSPNNDDQNRPTLRRTTSTDKQDGSTDKKGDDRPTLKRRD